MRPPPALELARRVGGDHRVELAREQQVVEGVARARLTTTPARQLDRDALGAARLVGPGLDPADAVERDAVARAASRPRA